MSFKSDVVAAKGDVSFERVLLEIADRLASRADFNLTPRVAGQVIGSVLHDLDQARELVAQQKAKAEAAEPAK